ncbi:MFS transporter [Streptomyces lunalinharesii]|uniref:Major facilitator superfamily (MFS) profile domain-containing protein n=1 Tax=Streptomyces lunalinharesii TaxID=333384 RepID=A0ABN3RX89_9ACTN
MRTWLPLVATCSGTFVLLVYSTIVTVALPSMAHDLHAGFGAAQWIVDVYPLALAGLLLGMGSLGDNLGRKRLYLSGLGVFGVATLACGLAGNAAVLIAARAVQGLTGAAMFSTLLPLIGLTYTGRDRGVAFAVWGAVAGAAAGTGNVAGGVLTQFLSWQWIFFAGVPVCALTMALSAVVLTDDTTTSTRIDHLGIATFTLAAIGITFGMIRGGERGWAATSTLLGLGFGRAGRSAAARWPSASAWVAGCWRCGCSRRPAAAVPVSRGCAAGVNAVWRAPPPRRIDDERPRIGFTPNSRIHFYGLKG